MGRRFIILMSVLLVGAFAFSGCSKKSDPSTAGSAVSEGTPSSDSGAGTGETDLLTINADGSISFPLVHFDYDQAQVRSEDFPKLQAAAEALMKNTSVRVTIEGHCDDRGSTEYNLALGERRAQSVVDYLARLGVARNRLTTISYGKERPLEMGSGESAWATNRRAAFVANR